MTKAHAQNRLHHCTTHCQMLDSWQQPHPRPFTHRADCFPSAAPASPSPAHDTLRSSLLSLPKPPVPPQGPSFLSEGKAHLPLPCVTRGEVLKLSARSLRCRARLTRGPALSLPPTAAYLLCISATCHCPLPSARLPSPEHSPLLTCPPQVALKSADCTRPATPAMPGTAATVATAA